MNALTSLKSAWRTAQLFVAFHQSKDGQPKPRLWAPKNGTAGLSDGSADKDAVVIVRGDGDARDVVIKVQSTEMILHRDNDAVGWSDVRVDHYGVSVLVGDVWVTVQANGSIKRHVDGQVDDASWIESDGSFVRINPEVEILVSGDGSELTRRTDTRFDGITADGVVSRSR